jgi:hypothetical protein
LGKVAMKIAVVDWQAMAIRQTGTASQLSAGFG